MITIDVKSALIYLLLIAIIVLVVYLVIMARHLVQTIKKTNQILDDASVISGAAAEKTVQIGEIVDEVQSAAADLAKAVKGEQKLVAAVSNIVKAVGNLSALVGKQETEEHSVRGKNKK